MKSRFSRVFLLMMSLGFILAIASRLMPAYSSDPTLAAAIDTNERIEQIEQTWRGQYETYYEIESPSASLTTDEINQALGKLADETGNKFALIYLFPHPEELETVLVIPGMAPMRQIFPDVPSERLLSVVNEFKSYVSRPADTARYFAPSNQLYDWMIAPLEAELQAQNINTLIFCAGESLRSLPIAALHDGQQFLVEKYSIGRIPAFSLTNRDRTTVQNTQILAMGVSEFQNLPDLPAVPLELTAITQNLWQSETFLNQEFTLDTLEEQLESEDYSIVHLATHAEFQPGKPSNSYIQLWQGDRLQLDQLQQLDWRRLPVEILVLSACQTALGDREAELGFAGLAYHAGVKSSLASLWQISDLGTLALMREFYWQLANPAVSTKAEALQRAQISLLNGQVSIKNGQLQSSGQTLSLPEDLKEFSNLDFSSPYYWAAFTLVGSPW
jgi:CHAT domain-containing protein